MTKMEMLLARVKQVVGESPSRIVTMIVVVDEHGEPKLWSPEVSGRMEGIEKTVIIAETNGPKPAMS